MAAPIHVARRLNQQSIVKFRRGCVPFPGFPPSQSGLVREKIDNHEADVVASARVFSAGIAQACDQANRFLFHSRENAGSASPARTYFFCSFSFGAGAPPLPPGAGAPFAPAAAAPLPPAAGAASSPSSFLAV